MQYTHDFYDRKPKLQNHVYSNFDIEYISNELLNIKGWEYKYYEFW